MTLDRVRLFRHYDASVGPKLKKHEKRIIMLIKPSARSGFHICEPSSATLGMASTRVQQQHNS